MIDVWLAKKCDDPCAACGLESPCVTGFQKQRRWSVITILLISAAGHRGAAHSLTARCFPGKQCCRSHLLIRCPLSVVAEGGVSVGCTAVPKFSAFPNYRRWGVLWRITWTSVPTGRVQLGSTVKPKEGFFHRKDISALCLQAVLEEERRVGRGLEIVICSLPSSQGIQKFVLLKTGLFSSLVKKECLSNHQTHRNIHSQFGIGSAEINYILTLFYFTIQIFLFLGLKSCWTGTGRSRGAHSAAASMPCFLLASRVAFVFRHWRKDTRQPG